MDGLLMREWVVVSSKPKYLYAWVAFSVSVRHHHNPIWCILCTYTDYSRYSACNNYLCLYASPIFKVWKIISSFWRRKGKQNQINSTHTRFLCLLLDVIIVIKLMLVPVVNSCMIKLASSDLTLTPLWLHQHQKESRCSLHRRRRLTSLRL
jgi:hypothetical protein